MTYTVRTAKPLDKVCSRQGRFSKHNVTVEYTWELLTPIFSLLLGYETSLPPPFTGILLRLLSNWTVAVKLSCGGWRGVQRGGLFQKWNMSDSSSALLAESLVFLHGGQPTRVSKQEKGGPSDCGAQCGLKPFLRRQMVLRVIFPGC